MSALSFNARDLQFFNVQSAVPGVPVPAVYSALFRHWPILGSAKGDIGFDY